MCGGDRHAEVYGRWVYGRWVYGWREVGEIEESYATFCSREEQRERSQQK